ncbi:hypothetical protein BYZ73_05385 [Rhodovulum viride]|uniref:Glycosyltransferase involved in cell wall biosynthesis n=1 Tax=Rhodovulum viride TaxID=1231134 RepID=A0ABX9DKK9_9RHOB|nr:glycosyltransferase [Rhodovulum viride]RAP42199.1 hypothetical protein BYZ73_05385 [Rhodovulum viride]
MRRIRVAPTETIRIATQARDGIVSLEAQATCPARIGTETATRRVEPGDGPVRLALPGRRHLVWQVDGAPAVTISLYRPDQRVLGALSAATALALLPLRHAGDIAAYFLRGDSGAGTRLERALIPGAEAALQNTPAAGSETPLAARLAGLGSAKPVPVFLGHRLGGGAELWLADRIAAERAQGNVALVLRDDPAGVLAELHDSGPPVHQRLSRAGAADLLSRPARIRLIYSNLVGAADPLGLLNDMLDRLRPQDRFELIFHDFLPLCPSHTLIGSAGRFCGLPDPVSCQSCYRKLAVTSGARPPRIETWRQAWHRAATRADEIVVFSADSARRVARVWPDLAPHLVLRPHHVGHLPPRLAPPSGPARLGVLGRIGYAKGAAVLKALAALPDRGFEIVVLGEIDPAFAHPGMTVHGRYRRDEIATLAASHTIGAWFVPAIWPETFSYTVHECLATGLPVLAFDIGAQGETAAARPNGQVLPLDASPRDLADRLAAALAGAAQSSAASSNEAQSLR